MKVYWLVVNYFWQYIYQLEQLIKKLTREIVDTQKEIILTLGQVLETRSIEAAGHVKRVSEYMALLARLAGLEENEVMLMKSASPMHDIGKIGIPDAILNKPGKLTPEERIAIQEHSTLGYNLLKESKRKLLKTAAVIAYQHHENWNGSGYPQGLKETEIHIFGRIAAIADVFDALSHNRCYRKAWPQKNIERFFMDQKGKQFDPELTDLFLNNIHRFTEISEQIPDDK